VERPPTEVVFCQLKDCQGKRKKDLELYESLSSRGGGGGGRGGEDQREGEMSICLLRMTLARAGERKGREKKGGGGGELGENTNIY